MINTLALLLLGIIPKLDDGVLVDSVDCVELAHFYDENGRLVFDQFIFWAWFPYECTQHIRDWRLVKSDAAFTLPYYDYQLKCYRFIFHDSQGGFRDLRFNSTIETWEQYDRELIDREALPVERRRRLKMRTIQPWQRELPTGGEMP